MVNRRPLTSKGLSIDTPLGVVVYMVSWQHASAFDLKEGPVQPCNRATGNKKSTKNFTNHNQSSKSTTVDMVDIAMAITNVLFFTRMKDRLTNVVGVCWSELVLKP